MPNTIDVTKPVAEVVGSVLHLERFEERDPEVVNLVSAAEDAESAVHRAMQTGARALGLARVSIDSSAVEQAFGGMSREFDGALGETVEQIEEITKTLFAEEDGEITQALAGWKAEVNELLGETFDPDSKRSVLAKFDKILADASERQVDAIKRLIDPDREDSPLGRQRAEIVKVFKEGQHALAKAVQEVSEKIAVSKAQTELIEKTSGKGFTFEDLVHRTVSRIAGAHGDIAEQVGRTVGVTANQAGDEVVTLELEDTRGASAQYVLELKDRKLGLKQTFEELDRAMANRDASAGIAVFSREEHAPIGTPFQFWGNCAIVVLDKDLVDDGPLRLACFWARWVVRRQLADDGSGISLSKVEGLIDEARRALDRVSTVRRCHTSARKKIDEAANQVNDLGSEVEAVLDAIASELRS